MGNITDSIQMCPPHHSANICSVRQACAAGCEPSATSASIFPDHCTSQTLVVEIDIPGVKVESGCLFFSEDGLLLNVVDDSVLTMEQNGCVESRTDGCFTLLLDCVPHSVHFLFFVACTLRNKFMDGSRSRVSVLASDGECLFSQSKSAHGDGNAMVIFAVVRDNPAGSGKSRWRAEAVARTYHIFSGKEPLVTIGRHLESLATAKAPLGSASRSGSSEPLGRGLHVTAFPSSDVRFTAIGRDTGGCRFLLPGDSYHDEKIVMQDMDPSKASRTLGAQNGAMNSHHSL